MEDVLTTHEVARALKVTPRHVLNLIDSGILTGFRIGRVWRIHSESLTALLASGKLPTLEAENNAVS